MTLRIGENIKKNRKGQNITQEELAKALGVSCQSVSRWENNSCYPEIELLPTIAAFFGISTDKLIGVDFAEENAAILYVERFHNALNIGNINECINIGREGAAKLPNNYTILNILMHALYEAENDSKNASKANDYAGDYDPEIVAIGERIMNHCLNSDIRFEAVERLALQHFKMGRKNQGRLLLETLPSITNCKETAIWEFLEEEERLPHIRSLINKSYAILSDSIHRLSFLLSDEDANKLYRKIAELKRIIYDDSFIDFMYNSN